MADLRKVVYRILRDYGHDVHLQRRIRDKEIGQYFTQQYSRRVERHTVRHMHSSSVALAGATQQEREGVVSNVDRVYWFRWDVNPAEGDIIIDSKPTDGMTGSKHVRREPEKFVIDYAQPMRGNGGRIEYWACGVSRTGPE